MVECDNLVKKHKVNILEIAVVLCVELNPRLAVFDIIISEISDKSAAESRQIVEARRLVTVEHGFYILPRIVVYFF